jgi:hypothetical protein
MKDLFNAIVGKEEVDESTNLMRTILCNHHREQERKLWDLNLVRATISLLSDEELPAYVNSLPTEVIKKLR